MADGGSTIWFKIKSLFSGEGFKSFQKEVKGSDRTAQSLGQSLDSVSHSLSGLAGDAESTGARFVGAVGDMTGSVKNLFKSISQGSLWAAGAAALDLMVKGVVKLVDLNKQYSTSAQYAKQQTEAFNQAFADMLKTSKAALEDIANGYKSVEAAINAALKKRTEEISSTMTLLKAEAELAKQREIEAGGTGEKAELKAKQDQLDLTLEQIAAEREASEMRKSNAQKTIDDSRREIADLEEKRQALEAQKRQWEELAAAKAKDGGMLDKLYGLFDSVEGKAASAEKRAQEALAKMAESESVKNLKTKIDEINKLIEQSQATAEKAAQAVENETAALARNAEKEATVITQAQADKLRAENEYAAKVKQIREQMARDAKEFIEEGDRIYDEARKKRIEEEKKADKEILENRKKTLQEDLKAQLQHLDQNQKLVQQKAQEWEQKAQGARGKKFSDWWLQEEDRIREENKQRQKMEWEKANIERQVENLEDRERKGQLSNREKERLEGMRQWLDAQKAGNNPFMKQLREINKERDKALKACEDELKDINQRLKNLGLK